MCSSGPRATAIADSVDGVEPGQVWRVFGDGHLREGWSRRMRPFRHWRIRAGKPICVLKSHWVGTASRGRQRLESESPPMSDALGMMIHVLVEKCAHRWNDVDEDAKSAVRLRLIDECMRFDPLISSSPLDFLWSMMRFAFLDATGKTRKIGAHETSLEQWRSKERLDGD